VFAVDTIAAIATPIGVSALGIVRLSGPDAMAVASRVFGGGKLATPYPESHTLRHGRLINPSTQEPIDDVVMALFRAPASYTGEDVVEFSCHGGIAIIRAALSALLAAGARLAEPGEFTKRAFLNGKLDLAQAEAVNDLIRATAEGARRTALNQLSGGLSREVKSLRGRLMDILASIEAAVDFPEDVPEPAPDQVISGISAAIDAIAELRSSFRGGRVFREGLRVVIAGRVNVGKSSVLNALLKYSRAIVTPIPGTTRDIIEESLQIEGIPIVAIDTAGIRQTDNPVEKIGVELTEHMLESADLILAVIDISEGIKEADVELLQRIGNRRAIVVLNKIDLLSEKARGLETKEYVGRLGRSVPAVQTCAFSGQGIDELESEIARQATDGGPVAESPLVTNARHDGLLESAFDSLENALDAATASKPIDLVSIDLTAAANALGRITGETASEDLIDRIFSEFCIGK
jgi:tRNA modification GTPase